mmetsp:Transcript_82293/g.155134  ORF Transcript_82293/g.155134 Transcript_82293/m.155134 type:complete len:213 (-) Transcript_82293:167-805(-)
MEFTGFTINARMAFGQNFAQASTRPFAMSAFTLKRSSRVMPGLRGMPAGMSTKSQPVRHSSKLSIGFSPTFITKPLTATFFSMWFKSAATPAGGTIATSKSNTHNSLTLGSVAISNDKGCPIPPAPPQTQTLKALGVFFSLGALALALAFTFAFALAFGSASFAFALALALALGSASFALALALDLALDLAFFTGSSVSQYASIAFFLYLPL